MAAHPSILALGNPRERGAWWATVHGVTKSWAQLCKHTDACKLLCVDRTHKLFLQLFRHEWLRSGHFESIGFSCFVLWSFCLDSFKICICALSAFVLQNTSTIGGDYIMYNSRILANRKCRQDVVTQIQVDPYGVCSPQFEKHWLENETSVPLRETQMK